MEWNITQRRRSGMGNRLSEFVCNSFGNGVFVGGYAFGRGAEPADQPFKRDVQCTCGFEHGFIEFTDRSRNEHERIPSIYGQRIARVQPTFEWIGNHSDGNVCQSLGCVIGILKIKSEWHVETVIPFFFIFKPQTHRKLEVSFSQEPVVLCNLWCIGGFSIGGSRLVRARYCETEPCALIL